MRQLLCFDGAETGFFEIFARLLFAPHGAQALAALGQRDGHAVHRRAGVEHRAERMADVVADVARAPDVLHQVHPVGFQGAADSLQDVQRPGLVVDGVERRDDIEGLGLGRLVEAGQIALDELDIPQAFRRRGGLPALGGHLQVPEFRHGRSTDFTPASPADCRRYRFPGSGATRAP